MKDWLDDAFLCSQSGITTVCDVMFAYVWLCISEFVWTCVSSSYGGAGRGRHQDLLPGEARWERHSSGDFITPLRMNRSLEHFRIHSSYPSQDPETECYNWGRFRSPRSQEKQEGLVVDRCLWACGHCEILTNTIAWTRVLWIPVEACLCAVNNWEYFVVFFFSKVSGLPERRLSVFHCVAAVRIPLMFSLLCPQFVPFRDYMDRTGNHVLSMARLAKDVLAEIPDQFISYMKSRGIKPNPAPPPYTPPGHTHHHTQIWGRPLGVWLRTNSVQLPRSPAGTLCLLFLWWKGEPTHQEVIVEFPRVRQNSTQSSIVSLSSRVDLSVFSRREDANYPGVMGKKPFFGRRSAVTVWRLTWQQVGWLSSCCGSNLCLSVIVSLTISGHGKIYPSSLGPRCGLFPVVLSGDLPLLDLVFIFENTARMWYRTTVWSVKREYDSSY